MPHRGLCSRNSSQTSLGTYVQDRSSPRHPSHSADTSPKHPPSSSCRSATCRLSTLATICMRIPAMAGGLAIRNDVQCWFVVEETKSTGQLVYSYLTTSCIDELLNGWMQSQTSGASEACITPVSQPPPHVVGYLRIEEHSSYRTAEAWLEGGLIMIDCRRMPL